MHHATPRLLELRLGQVQAFGPQGEPSAILKTPVTGRVQLTAAGLAGDQQADRRHHGGPDKALHHYPLEHYAAWRQELPERAAWLETPGLFGENLSTLGMLETEVCLGDIYRLGSAVLQVSQGRQPCWKLAHRLELADLPARIRANGRTGWYYRVLEVGEVAAGDDFQLLSRAWPDWPLARLWTVLFGAGRDVLALEILADLPVLAASWRERAAQRLATP